MFSYQLGDNQQQQRIRLVTDRGAVLGPTNPWGLMPVEFFRVEKILEQVFLAHSSTALKDEFSAALLNRLNKRRWRNWDEIRAPFHPPPGHQIVAMELYLVDIDFATCDPADPRQVRQATLLHRHDPLGVLAIGDSEPPWHWKKGA
jgi:hypothetical protein